MFQQFPCDEPLFNNRSADSILADYQQDNQWLHEDSSVENMIPMLRENLSQNEVLALGIEKFAQKANISGLLNWFYLMVQKGYQVPEYLAIESICLAELMKAKSLLEQEERTKLNNFVRVSMSKRVKDKLQSENNDSFIYLYKAHLLKAQLEPIKN